jgi:hypothetical protein
VKRPRRASTSRSNSPAKARQRPDYPVDVPDSDGIEVVGEDDAALEQELTESGQWLPCVPPEPTRKHDIPSSSAIMVAG